MRQGENISERFARKVEPDPNSGCWLWAAITTPNGYGKIKIGGKYRSAHRLAWEMANGPIPRGEGYHGTCVLHRCDTPACVNPDHLFLGTQTTNMADRDAKGRTARGDTHGSVTLNKRSKSRIGGGGADS